MICADFLPSAKLLVEGRTSRAHFVNPDYRTSEGIVDGAGKIGILTGGGDVPGLNSVIKSVVYVQARWVMGFAGDGRV
jgi:hypothetical protein